MELSTVNRERETLAEDGISSIEPTVLWGREDGSAVLIPERDDGPCILWVKGRCPANCHRCEDFRSEMRYD